MNFEKGYLDLNNIIITIHSVTYHRIIFVNGKVVYIGTTLNFLKQILNLKRKFKSIKTWIAVDDSRSNLKYNLFPDYKSSRKKREKEDYNRFINQKLVIISLLKYIGVSYLKKEGLEADEIIFNLVKEGSNLIVSTDNDFYSCLTNGNAIYKRKKLITKRKFKRDFDIEPKNYALLQSLVGKGGSFIPGVEGIGNKRATEIIKLNKKNFLMKLTKEKLTGQPKLLQKLYDNKRLIKRNYELFSNAGSDMNNIIIEKTVIDRKNKRLKTLINKCESLFQVV